MTIVVTTNVVFNDKSDGWRLNSAQETITINSENNIGKTSLYMTIMVSAPAAIDI